MTTIAWKGGVLAADSMVNVGQTIVSRRSEKIRRLPDGCLFAFTGVMADALSVLEAFQRGDENLPVIEDGTNCIVVNPDGEVFTYDGRGPLMVWEDDVGAWGSGADFAYGAMYAGASAAKAVKAACARSAYSCEPVRTMRVSNKRKGRK